MTIQEILDEIDNLLLEASRVPFTNKRIIEEDEIARLLDDLREVIPREIIEANRIIVERQRILDEAQKDAQNIIDQAKSYVTKLTDENIITKQAHDQANEIICEARKTARKLQNDAIMYASDVFKYLETNLEKALEVVRQGHNQIQQTKQDQ